MTDDDDEIEVDLNKKPIWQLTTVMSFGKYKGETVKYILETEPKLLIWYENNIEWFELDESVLIMAEARTRRKQESEWHYGSGGVHDDFDDEDED